MYSAHLSSVLRHEDREEFPSFQMEVEHFAHRHPGLQPFITEMLATFATHTKKFPKSPDEAYAHIFEENCEWCQRELEAAKERHTKHL